MYCSDLLSVNTGEENAAGLSIEEENVLLYELSKVFLGDSLKELDVLL